MSEGKRKTLEEFSYNTNKFKDKIIKIQGYSANVVSNVKNYTNKIDLLFIDANHEYKSVKTDWELYKCFLSSGSIVIFHDYKWSDGVYKVVNLDVVPYCTKFNSISNIWWGWIK